MPFSAELLEARKVLSRRLLGGAFRLPRTASSRLPVAMSAAAGSVHAVGLGAKVVDGRDTQTVAIRIYVTQKLPRGLISIAARLPEQIGGFPTDVIEAAPAFL